MKLVAAIAAATVVFTTFINAQLTNTIDVYDYVIVGGGVGGLALASRLSENKSITVVVLEAGPNAEDQFAIYAPGMYGQAVGTDLCPLLPTVPQKHMNNRKMNIAAGKLLGGGSAINANVWTRGALKDFDAWEELGNPGWNGKTIFDYFKKIENLSPPSPDQVQYGATYQPNVHGTNGPIHISFPRFEFPQTANWNASLEAINFKQSQDLLNGTLHGYSITPNTLNPANARRSDAYLGYIKPNVARQNLAVLANHTASRIVFDTQTKRSLLKAIGVEWYTTGKKDSKYVIKARREVIVSAGAIGSPKLLEVSGIGAKDIVIAAGVKSLIDLPGVGSNMQDHIHAVTVSTTNIKGYTTNSVFANKTLADEQKEQLLKYKTGIWTTAPNNLAYPSPSQLFTNTTFQSGKHLAALIRQSVDQWAEHYASQNTSNSVLLKKQYEIVARSYEENYLSPIEVNYSPGYGGTSKVDIVNKKYQTVNNILIAPLSRGFTHIVSSDIEDEVTINPQYYSHPLDLDVHVAATKLTRSILTAPGLASINSGEFEPGPNVISDEDIKQWLSNNVRSDWHPLGTCAMVPEELGGVVDPDLKVYGTANLRVVDASIMPLSISSHLMQPVYAISEKAADIIKKTIN